MPTLAEAIETAVTRELAHRTTTPEAAAYTLEALAARVRALAVEAAAAVHARSFRPSISEVQHAVARWSGWSVLQLKSPVKVAALALTRQLAMYLSRELTGESYHGIAQAFGGRDHTTVIYACQKIARLLDERPDFASEAQLLREALSRHPLQHPAAPAVPAPSAEAPPPPAPLAPLAGPDPARTPERQRIRAGMKAARLAASATGARPVDLAAVKAGLAAAPARPPVPYREPAPTPHTAPPRAEPAGSWRLL